MNFGQIKVNEIAAIAQEVQDQRKREVMLKALLTAPGLAAAFVAETEAEIALLEKQIALLDACRRYIEEPFRTPTTFIQADRLAIELSYDTDPLQQEIQAATEARKRVKSANIRDCIAQCQALARCKLLNQNVIYQKIRIKHMSEFLSEVRSWDRGRVSWELHQREMERSRTVYRTGVGPFSVFTTRDLTVNNDPYALACEFLRDLIIELHKIMNKEAGVPAVDPLIETVAQKAIAELTLRVGTQLKRDQLVAKADELKKILPASSHRDLDELFRREIDKLLKGGHP